MADDAIVPLGGFLTPECSQFFKQPSLPSFASCLHSEPCFGLLPESNTPNPFSLVSCVGQKSGLTEPLENTVNYLQKSVVKQTTSEVNHVGTETAGVLYNTMQAVIQVGSGPYVGGIGNGISW